MKLRHLKKICVGESFVTAEHVIYKRISWDGYMFLFYCASLYDEASTCLFKLSSTRIQPKLVCLSVMFVCLHDHDLSAWPRSVWVTSICLPDLNLSAWPRATSICVTIIRRNYYEKLVRINYFKLEWICTS